MKYPEHESVILEFKRIIPKNEQIIKTIVGFCNRHGGKLIIGVDNDRTIVGIPEDEMQPILEYLDKSIHEACRPPVIPTIYAQRFGDKSILIIEVSSGMNKPYFIASEGLQKGTYIRLGRNTIRTTEDIIEELKWQSRGMSFDMMPVYQANKNDLDVKEFKEFLKNRKLKDIKIKKASIENALSAYHMVVKEHDKEYPTVAGILLFGKKTQKYLSEAFIIGTHFATDSIGKALASKDFIGTIPTQFEEAYSFIISRLNHWYTFEGPRRIDHLEIPSEAIREVLLNALIHRNYHIQAPIKIAIFSNRVEIFSPGTFAGLITPDNIKMGFTFIRNIAITKAMREMGYIEKLGSGFSILFNSYKARNLPEPQVIEGDMFVKVILPRPSASYIPPELKTIDIEDEENDDLKKILKLIERKNKITIKDVISELDSSRATVGRRLSSMVQKGLIKKVGEKRAAHYKFK